MKILVTGAAGFLASHVADALVVAGHDVLAFDQVEVKTHPAVRGDLLDPTSLKAALTGCEAVCHLAAIGDVYLAAERPPLAAQVNVTGTANVCEAALVAGARVVLASTWEVYGEPHTDPIDETHPCDPDHPYSITKLAGERIALAYGRLKKLRVTALRLGTAYGTRMRPNSVFSLFIDRALRGEPLTIHGSGAQTRQFTHASDIARAFVAAATSPDDARVYNIVAEEAVSIRGLAEKVVAQIPTSLTFGEARAGDVPSARVSSARASSELHWRAEMPFDRGLAEIVEERRRLARVPS